MERRQFYMSELLAFTHLLNHLFGPMVGAFSAIHRAFIPAKAAAPINDTFAIELLVAWA